MNLKLELEFSKADILKDVDALKKQIDAMRPLPEDVEGRVMQKLRLDWNYHSNAIEGNRLNYGETVAFLMEGITAKGKPLKDHLDIRGHNEAINFLLEIVKDTRLISEADIRALHEMVLVEPYDSPATTPDGLPTVKRITLGEYKSSLNHVKTATGEIHYYATPEETPAKMQELMEWHGEAVDNGIHPVVIAALFHHKFVEIHPFDDGNGRLSRILMNLILMQKGYPPVVVKLDDRTNYYSLLSRADVGDSWPFVEYIAERLQNSLQLFLKAASGGDINEEEDIDKRILLFKIEAESKIHVGDEKTNNRVKEIINTQLLELFAKISKKMQSLNDLFMNFDVGITLYNKAEPSEIDAIYDQTSRIIAHLDNSQYIDFTKHSLTSIRDLVYKQKNEFTEILFVTNHERFKNSNNMFSLENKIIVEFNQYNYSISVNNYSGILTKDYNGLLTSKDMNKVIDFFFNQFMDSFQLLNQKSPKP